MANKPLQDLGMPSPNRIAAVSTCVELDREQGKAVLIPRIPMIPTDLPFQFKRLQFPIRLAFAITINKTQGQSLEKCGIDLNTDCFSHGQLYVACSRVGKPDNLFICSDNWTAKNVVYSQVLRS